MAAMPTAHGKSAKSVKGKPFAKGDDPRRGKSGGRPPNTVSLTAIATRFLAMTPKAIADEVGAAAARLKGLGNQSSMAEIIVASFLYSLANDPQPGNMRELWRRVDGEVPQPVQLSGPDEGPIQVESFDYAAATAAIAARPDQHRDAPGEGEGNFDGPALGQDDDGG